MTTLIPFTPSNTSNPPFSTPVTLDGASYVLNVGWNFYGQRYYMTISDTSGNVVWNGAMVGSPLSYDIFLAPGVFSQSTILFREDSGNIEVTP
ncbi:phage baseplate plug family protein [Burkholderia glumae]|uniref:phage baseplate plug family protein n=1 Tax=Burkholderia glumae TaxID=337 RepID=UPI003B992659